MPDAKIQCDHCDQWLLVENGNSAECDCGAVFAVTVTKLLRPVTDVVETSR
jgi:branched-subunit amino acid aminotransferase/4-amino-4-deoxychorismate lyase